MNEGVAKTADCALRAALRSLATEPRVTGVFLDLDGVLAEIRPRPEQARVPAATKTLLSHLVAAYALVAVVSGRSGADVAELLSGVAPAMVGSHGAEVCWQGRWERPTVPAPGAIERLTATLEDDPVLRAVGVTVERKALSVALHARTAPDQGAALAAASRAAEELGRVAGLEMLRGRQVVELRSPGVDKGAAVRGLIERAGLRAAVYVGDDRTDLDAVMALHRLRSAGDVRALTLAVYSPEAPPELLGAVDLVIAYRQVRTVLQCLIELGRAS